VLVTPVLQVVQRLVTHHLLGRLPETCHSAASACGHYE
jgi:hypothetical protein